MDWAVPDKRHPTWTWRQVSMQHIRHMWCKSPRLRAAASGPEPHLFNCKSSYYHIGTEQKQEYLKGRSCMLTLEVVFWTVLPKQTNNGLLLVNICYTSFEKVTCWVDFVQENMSWNLHFYYGLTGKYLNFCSHEALLYSRQEGQNRNEVIETWRKKEVL